MKNFFIGSLTAMGVLGIVQDAGGARVNPMLAPWEAPYEGVPFDKIVPSDLEDAVMEGIRLHDLEIKAIASNPDMPDFENTIAALDRSGVVLSRAMATLGNLESAVGDSEVMDIVARVTPAVSSHETGILLNEGLWQRVMHVYRHRDERKDLTPEAQRLIEETYRGFAENGAALEGADREKYRRLSAELSDLRVRFSQNVTNGMSDKSRRMWIDEAGTAGLPEADKNAARMAAKEALEADGKTDDPGQYLITVYFPSYAPFMKYADDRALREKLYRINGSRNVGGEYDNTQILKDIANIRLEIANLMGKETFADYHLQGTMAGTPDKVTGLLEDLRVRYTEPMRAEVKEIEEFARKTEGPDFELKPWDYSYWADKLKNGRYAFNDEDLKPYFELDSTIDGVLGLATRLFGFKFRLCRDIPVYHPDVRAYEVYDASGAILGVLYADFFYRPGKSPGAWMTEFRPSTKDDSGNRELPLISIVMNFSKPVGDAPVLLTPYEVETFLHEFGHALHGLSTQATYATLSGTNVYHDFVELFSQFNENYLGEKEFLDGWARHYKTGKKLPEELLSKFEKSRQFGAAYNCMRQLRFGYLDMAYHTLREPFRASGDVAAFEKEAQDPVRIFDTVEGCLTSPSFGHIFSGGYAAGYYGYKWAEVLDADAFAAFKEKGVFDKNTSSRYLKMMQSGGTADPMQLYIEFRGKEPTVDALLERDGIK